MARSPRPETMRSPLTTSCPLPPVAGASAPTVFFSTTSAAVMRAVAGPPAPAPVATATPCSSGVSSVSFFSVVLPTWALPRRSMRV